MSPLSAFIYALRITCDFLAFVAFVSADGHCHPTGVFLDFSPIFFELVSLFSLFFLDCTRDFRNHWIKGKSKLNCPRGCADQKFTTVRVLNVAQTQELFARPFSDFGPVSPFPAPFSAFPLGAHLKLRVLPLHLAANIRSVKWLCGWFYITLTDSRSKRKSEKIIARMEEAGEWGSAAGPAGLSPGGACMCAFDFWPTWMLNAHLFPANASSWLFYWAASPASVAFRAEIAPDMQFASWFRCATNPLCIHICSNLGNFYSYFWLLHIEKWSLS